MTSGRVLIIGGGLGGLALAQGLRRAKISFTVFERDSSPNFRPQGYRLRISPEGANALAEVLEPDLWQLFEQTCATTKLGLTRVNAVDGTPAEKDAGSDPARDALKRSRGKNSNMQMPFTADRTVLRTVLMTGLEDNLSFGKQFERYSITPNGITAFFEDGSCEHGTLLVSADGVRSPVRKQYLPDQVVVDTDGRCIYGKTPLTQEVADKLPSETMTLVSDESPLTLLLEPVRFAQDPAQFFDGRLESIKDYVYWVLLSRKATFGLDDNELVEFSGEDAKQLSLKLTSHWKPWCRSVLEAQDTQQSSILRISSAIPTMKPWAPSANVTLLGDAIHAMSPTAGAGANTALKDAAHLCRAIVGGASAETIGRYETEMRAFAQIAIEGSYMGGKRMYNQPAFEDCKPVDF
ncbi:hypothetical protein V1517DRAFT_315575 [Lipomyces orientalis]|uniref:Uncharacterized protein n=1 Tax=Lipomyces orientalis TaxID=1233043 RepID=A0ACC3TVN1_9ASCO